VKRVLASRCARQQASYAERIVPDASLEEKLKQLAEIRTQEGYMAEVKREGASGFLFLENHCPICAAATVCQGFCETELELFRSVLGAEISVERVEHIIAGDRRCAYRITPGTKGARSRRTPTENRSRGQR
jgi:predicted ArsR family transcriptional regulator